MLSRKYIKKSRKKSASHKYIKKSKKVFSSHKQIKNKNAKYLTKMIGSGGIYHKPQPPNMNDPEYIEYMINNATVSLKYTLDNYDGIDAIDDTINILFSESGIIFLKHKPEFRIGIINKMQTLLDKLKTYKEGREKEGEEQIPIDDNLEEYFNINNDESLFNKMENVIALAQDINNEI